MIKIYDAGENRAIYEDTESGLLQAEALPNRKANHARLETLKGELLNVIEGSL